MIDVVVFVEVKGLLELERAEKWEEARALLYKQWNADRGNVDLFLRVFSECWYVLCEWDAVVDAKGLSWDIFQDTLIECTTYGLAHFGKETRFLWAGGYMIALFPDLFYRGEGLDKKDIDALYLEWESKAYEMSELAGRKDPDDPLIRYYYVRLPSVLARGIDEYKEAKRRLVPLLGQYFPGDTAIEEYFRDI